MTLPDQTGPIFPGVVFRRILSIGANCETAHQLRRTDRYQTASLFDWLVTPLDSVIAVLADDGARLATEFLSANEGTSVRCAAYDVLYHHEFPRAAQDLVSFSTDAIDRCRSKMTHKMQTLLQALSAPEPVLLIRGYPASDLGWDRFHASGTDASADDLNKLAAAVGQRFPKADFRLLVLRLEPCGALQGAERLDPRIAVRTLERPSEPGSWAASDSAWDAVLDQIAYEPERKEPQSLETLYWF
jgi:hypothetical protein